ncbi:hypothetical protein GCM10027053_27900 [Intrasporangium mesophilum]
MAGDELHPDDEAMLDHLRAIADVVDPVPEDVIELGKAAFALHHADAILMTMATDELSGASVRASRGDQGSSRLHVFEHGSVSIEVEATSRGDFARAIGVVDDREHPDLADHQMTLETKSSSTTVDLDGGRFTFERVPLGLARLVLEHSGERVMTTTWFDVD